MGSSPPLSGSDLGQNWDKNGMKMILEIEKERKRQIKAKKDEVIREIYGSPWHETVQVQLL